MSERMIIDVLPARNNILLGIVATNTGNAVVDAMIRGAFRACLEELDDAPKVEVQEYLPLVKRIASSWPTLLASSAVISPGLND